VWGGVANQSASAGRANVWCCRPRPGKDPALHKLLLAALPVLGPGAAATLPLLVLHVTLQE
jgi:hypothetical protein